MLGIRLEVLSPQVSGCGKDKVAREPSSQRLRLERNNATHQGGALMKLFNSCRIPKAPAPTRYMRPASVLLSHTDKAPFCKHAYKETPPVTARYDNAKNVLVEMEVNETMSSYADSAQQKNQTTTHRDNACLTYGTEAEVLPFSRGNVASFTSARAGTERRQPRAPATKAQNMRVYVYTT